jgi:hypothetical protein
MDNNGFKDSILFDFGSEVVALDSVQFGYVYQDSDITVLAYTGDTASFAYDGLMYEDILTSSDWTSISPPADPTSPTLPNVGSSESFNTSHTVKSSYWVVATALDTYYSGLSDHLKLKKLTGELYAPPPLSSGVPEPAPLALMMLGLGVLAASRKSKKAA